MTDATALIPTERIAGAILQIRGQRVMLDSDLAELYGVETGALVRAVRRNAGRFPPDFMFQITEEEFAALRCQFGTSKDRGGRRYLPYAFTEQGVAMLSSVLRSPRAVQVNVAIMRAFVRLRQVLATNDDLARRMAELEARFDQYQEQLPAVVVEVFRQILAQPDPEPAPERRIGFRGEVRQG